MKCTFCDGEVNVDYRVNEIGDCYCNDECYEKHLDTNELSFNDDQHPYIDIYENVRSEYIYWVTNWKSEIKSGYNYIANSNEIIHKIDSFIDEHFEHYISDGDDGVFHFEIHQYLHKLRKLQKEIINWRPERDEYFTVTLIFDDSSEFKIDDEFAPVHSLKKYILERGKNKNQTNWLIEYIDIGYNSNEWRSSGEIYVWLTYDSLEEAEELAEAFQNFFSNELSEILIETSYLCDSGCGIYLNTSDAIINLDGWHYADSCAYLDFPGTYSEEELLELVDKEEDELSLPSNTDWSWFTAKVRRSCILLGIGYPYWALLDE